MKKILLLSTMVAVAAQLSATDYVVLREYGSAWTGGIEADLNGDGTIDMIYAGKQDNPKQIIVDGDGNEVETDRYSRFLLQDPSTGTFTVEDAPFLVAERPVFSYVDMDGDGILDLVVTEHITNDGAGSGVFKGLGNGIFEPVELSFDDSNYLFRGVTHCVSDFNNDGRPDIATLGYLNEDENIINYSAVLINQGNFTFNVTNTDLLSEYRLALSIVKSMDINNDGFMDFIVSSNNDTPGSKRVLTEIFLNFGAEEPGFFYPIDLGSSINMKGNGGLDIADLNGDGYLDFVLHGEGGPGMADPTTGDDWTCVSRVYLNNANESFTAKAQPNLDGLDIRPLNSTGTATRLFDWDGNGTYDLFITGWSPSYDTQAGVVLSMDNNALLGTPTRIPGSSEGMILFPDWNNDGKIDMFSTGHSWDAMWYSEEEMKGRTAAVLYNENASTERPTAPASVNAIVDGNNVTISWSEGSDDKTASKSLTYEYFIKKSNGTFLTTPASVIGGENDGNRKVRQMGNAQLNKEIPLYDLPDGSYTIGVQSIDASYQGSTFVTKEFQIGEASLVNLNNVCDFKVTTIGGTLSVETAAKATIQIYTLLGNILATVDNATNYQIDLAQGCYIVKVSDENGSSTQKVIVK